MDSAVLSLKKMNWQWNGKALVCPQYGSSLGIGKLGP